MHTPAPHKPLTGDLAMFTTLLKWSKCHYGPVRQQTLVPMLKALVGNYLGLEADSGALTPAVLSHWLLRAVRHYYPATPAEMQADTECFIDCAFKGPNALYDELIGRLVRVRVFDAASGTALVEVPANDTRVAALLQKAVTSYPVL